MYNQYREGFLEVICGCMFAGKTEELIRRINVLSYAKKNIKSFKPKTDNRYSDHEIVSHAGVHIPCMVVDKPKEILKYIDDDTDVVAIKGIRVMVAGLDKDFRGVPFPVIAELLPRAEFITKLTAVCAKCGAPATRTQRLINGKPASFEDPIIMIGSSEQYEPRCRHCHKILNKPHKF